MYTIRILTPDTAPFDIACDKTDFAAAVHLASGNGKNQFKVFMSGAQLMPKQMGWGEMPGFGWVERFDHEEQPKPATMLMLEVLHENTGLNDAEYEYSEAWPYADTEIGLKSATAAIYADIERCREEAQDEDGCPAPFQHARIYRCTLLDNGAYGNGDLIVEVLASEIE